MSELVLNTNNLKASHHCQSYYEEKLLVSVMDAFVENVAAETKYG